MPATTVVYTNRPDTLSGPLSLRRGGVSRFVLPDLQGHARQLTDSTGTVTDTLTADAWGVPKATSGATVNPYQSFGQWGYFTDTPSRLYVRARHLRVDLGRWVSRDPMGFDGGSWNLYHESQNNPGRLQDPTGLFCPPDGPKICGRSIDGWLLAEIEWQKKYSREYKIHFINKYKNWGLKAYARWAYLNMPYKWTEWYQFNLGLRITKHPCIYKCPVPWDKSPCGGTIWMCEKCVRTSTLGNIMYGYIGHHLGLSIEGLIRIIHELKGGSFDPYDDEAYRLGYIMYNEHRGGDPCPSFKKALKQYPNALFESGNQGLIDFSICKKCSQTVYQDPYHGAGKEHVLKDWGTGGTPSGGRYSEKPCP